jgi:hypothetical protein
MKKWVFVLMAFLSHVESVYASCGDAFRNPKVAEIFSTFDSEAQSTSRIWANYKASSSTIVLTDSAANPSCAIVRYPSGRLHTVLLSKPLPIPNNVYSFCGPWFGPCSPSLFTEGIVEAALLNYNNQLDSIASLFGVSEATVQALLTFHESFHYFAQVLGVPAGRWSAAIRGLGGSGRADLENKCYASSVGVIHLRRISMSKLVDALEAAWIHNDSQRAKSLAADYLTLRSQRLDLVRNETIADGSSTITCSEAETRMEMVEGTADYFSLMALYSLNRLSEQKVVDWIRLSVNSAADVSSHYYRFGAVPLLIMAKANMTEFQNVLDALVVATDPQSTITEQLKLWAER